MRVLIQPQVNLNGTSRHELVQQQREVLAALHLLQKTMASATPHGRDYQFRPDEYPQARLAWIERMEMVGNLYREIQAHALAIQKESE